MLNNVFLDIFLVSIKNISVKRVCFITFIKNQVKSDFLQFPLYSLTYQIWAIFE